ncbi:MAG: hypothetical protein GYA24_21630 [Candidatus Lokiarchaeota archaeon]|nr:hypothetical protein [Candidatus Lokiarchaeota archaeon]
MIAENTTNSITLPFKQRVLEQWKHDMKAAIVEMANMGLIEIKKPLSYWKSELEQINRVISERKVLAEEREARVDAFLREVEQWAGLHGMRTCDAVEDVEIAEERDLNESIDIALELERQREAEEAAKQEAIKK